MSGVGIGVVTVRLVLVLILAGLVKNELYIREVNDGGTGTEESAIEEDPREDAALDVAVDDSKMGFESIILLFEVLVCVYAFIL